jgi:penicillin-binding protein 1A
MSSRRRRLNRKRRKGRRRLATNLALASVLAAVMLLLGGVATAWAVAASWLEDLPDVDSPDLFAVSQTTKVYASDGQLLANLYLENRELVHLSEIATALVEATVAIEDERFYEHNGVDYYGSVRAALVDLTAGSIEEGASTLTQQYVDNTILLEEKLTNTEGLDRWKTKFREMWLALQIEKRYGKDDILNFYLNTVYYGEGAYGAEAAAKTYFGKHASELTLAEASMLAGIPQRPTYLNPYDYPEAAKSRQRTVLSLMVENGKSVPREMSVAVSPLVSISDRSTLEMSIVGAPV